MKRIAFGVTFRVYDLKKDKISREICQSSRFHLDSRFYMGQANQQFVQGLSPDKIKAMDKPVNS